MHFRPLRNNVNQIIIPMKTEYGKACEKLGRYPLTIENFSHEAERNRKQCFGEHKYRTCIEAANMDENGELFEPKPDDDYAVEIWYRRVRDTNRPSGVGFVFGDPVFDFDYATVGSRLLSRNRDIAKAIGSDPQVTEYFNEWRGV